MAWLQKTKRLNPDTGKKETYYRICWRENGKKCTRGIGFCEVMEAKRLLAIFDGQMAAGERPAARPSSAPASSTPPPMPVLADYLDQVFLPVVERDHAPKTYLGAVRAGNALKSILGHLRLDQVSYAAADAYISERKKLGRRSRTIILELRWLKQALAHARACQLIPEVPELPRIKDRDRKPHRFYTPEESERVLAALRPLDEQPHVVTRGKPPIYRDWLTYLAVLMALNAGLRKNEILTRTWEDVRWNLGPLGTLIVCAKPEVGYQVKMDRDRAVPLTPNLRHALLVAHQEVGCPSAGWIFPSPRDPSRPRQQFHHALNRACDRAGLPRIHPHGLRHTWATRLALAGVDRRTLMELGGWKEGRMLDEIYAHTTDEHKAEVMARLGIGRAETEKA